MEPSNPSSPVATAAMVLLFLLSPTIVLSEVSAAAPPGLTDPDKLTYRPLSFTPPKAQRRAFENGLILYTLPDHELPLVKVTAVIRTGTSYDPPQLEGLAELTGKVMRTGGVKGMTAAVLDETLESLAASLHLSVNRDSGQLSLSLLRKDVERGLELFSRILIQPSFAEEQLTLAKEMKIEELRRVADHPQKLAFRTFGRLIHEGSPRGRLATTASVSRICREDLVRFHEQNIRPGRVLLSISGDIDELVANNLVQRYFGQWQSPTSSEVPLPPATPAEGKLYTLSKEGSQSIVLFGWQAPAKKSSDFFPMEIIDFVVGSGGFRSRVFQEIRTNRGLAYSTGSFFNAQSDYGVFGAYALTKSESTIEVISLLRGIMGDMSRKPLTLSELEMTKRSILNSYLFSFTSANQIALQQLMTEFEGLPTAYLELYPASIAAVTAGEVLNTANKYLEPGKAIILIVADSDICRQIAESFKGVEKIENPL